MTIKECIDIVDNIKPNQYGIKDKVMWLSFLDETIINDVLKTHEGYDGRYDDFTGYTEDKLSVSLIVPSPYDRVYTAYLKMQIDKENGETARYNNSMALYNTYLLEYRKHYNKTHMPLSHDARPGRGVSVKVDVNLSEAEFEAIKRDVYNQLSEDVDEVISPDKLYDIVMSYVLNNTEMLKGKDGYTPKRGTDYLTEEEVTEIKKAAKGDDGYSPLVEIIPIEGGTRVYITDKNGRKFFDILNGADGKTVTSIDQLKGADQYLKKQGGRASVDYGEEGIDVNVNAQRSVTLGAEHVNILGEYEATFKANQGEIAADFSNQRITNIADPESEMDGVNKKYVDEVFEKIGDFEASVPTRTSDIVNDSGFITISDVPEAPSKVSQLVNDMGYITAADIPPGGGGGTSGNVPTKVSQLENDAGYITNFADEFFVDEMNVTGTLHTQSIYGHEGIDISSEHTSIGSIDGAGIDFGGYNTDRNYGQIEGDMRVQTPVNDASVANKGYVDNAVNGIPSWAKQPTKPTYTAEEVGAIAKNQGSANVGKILVVGSDGNLVLADMPATGDVIGTLDEENNILLSGNLADGTYTLKYENADGTYTEVGSIVVGAIEEEEEVIVNLIPTLTDIDLTTIYNDIGYKENARISLSKISDSNPTGEKAQADTTLLGIMPLGNDGDVLHLRGALFFDGSTYSGLIWYYDASGTLLNTATIGINSMQELIGTDANGDATFTLTHNKIQLIDGAAYIRLNIANPTGELIMTRNQLIPKD